MLKKWVFNFKVLGNGIDYCSENESDGDMSMDGALAFINDTQSQGKKNERWTVGGLKDTLSKAVNLRELVKLIGDTNLEDLVRLIDKEPKLVYSVAKKIGESMDEMAQLQNEKDISEEAIEKATNWMLTCGSLRWDRPEKPSNKKIKCIVDKDTTVGETKWLVELDQKWNQSNCKDKCWCSTNLSCVFKPQTHTHTHTKKVQILIKNKNINKM